MRVPDARVAIHAALTAVMLWLGFILMLPADTFGTDPASWRCFAQLASETTWAGAFWVAAAFGGAGLVTRRSVVRLASALVLASAHGAVAGLKLLSNPIGTGWGTYAIWAALGYYMALRRAREPA